MNLDKMDKRTVELAKFAVELFDGQPINVMFAMAHIIAEIIRLSEDKERVWEKWKETTEKLMALESNVLLGRATEQ